MKRGIRVKFSCCIETIYTQFPFIDRISKAAEAGFDYVEFWNWGNKDIPAIKKALADTKIKLATLQGSQGGVLVDSRDSETYIAGVRESLKLARELEAKAVFCMSDIMQEDRSVKPHQRPLTESEMFENSVKVLKVLARDAEKAGIILVIEPLNTRVDHAGYSLSHTADGVSIVKAVGSPYVRLLYDAYHMQIMEGNIIQSIRDYAQYFGHFHIADVPGRNQPGTGELNYINILKVLKQSGYDGIIGFEFFPMGKPDEEVIADVLYSFRGL